MQGQINITPKDYDDVINNTSFVVPSFTIQEFSDDFVC